MMTDNNTNVTNEKLQIENSHLKQEIELLQAKVKWYEENLRLAKQKRFGRSSEKIIDGQTSFFNEAEAEAKPEVPEPTVEEITYKRRKKVGRKEEQFEDLPVETIEYKLTEEEQICSCCGGKLHEMSTQVRKELKIIPAQVSVVEHVQHIYACRNCEKNDIKTPIKTATMPKPALPGSMASSSAIAYIMSQKFVDSMPLYRIEKHLERLDIELSRQTMSNWLIKASEKWLTPLYNRMQKELVKQDIIHADETTLQVLHEPEREPSSKSYMWLYCTGRYGPPIVLYDYQTSRSGKCPEKFLEGFNGYAHVDGYGGYDRLKDVKLSACWAHARRAFVDALKMLPKEATESKTLVETGVEFCNKLFKIEIDLKECTCEKRFDERMNQSKPILEEFFSWLKYYKPRALPKSPFGSAIKYCLNIWDKLITFMEDGRLEIDNNRAERAIKPFVIGRKNFLFCNTPKGANSSATIYSIVETAKANGLKPMEYLTFLFDTMPNMHIENEEELMKILPWSKEIPDYCRIKKTA